MRPRKYHVTLSDEEYNHLIDLTRKGIASAQKIRHAEILLKLDENHNEKAWTVNKIVETYHTNGTTVCAVAGRKMVHSKCRCRIYGSHGKCSGNLSAFL